MLRGTPGAGNGIEFIEKEVFQMQTIDPQSWKKDLPEFKEKTEAFYAGELDKGAYKGFSGFYGS